MGKDRKAGRRLGRDAQARLLCRPRPRVYDRHGGRGFRVSGSEPGPDGKRGYDAFLRYWRPREGLQAAVDRDRVRYDLWAKAGEIELTDGPVIRLAPIAQTLADAQAAFNLKAVAYDRYRLKELGDMMGDLGIAGLPMIEHPQGFRRATTHNPNAPQQKIDNPLWMPNSCQELENSIIEERLRVAINPALRWNVASAVVREDPAGTDNWIFDKRKATGRIDGLVALAMAIGAARDYGGWRPPASPWDVPGFSILAEG